MIVMHDVSLCWSNRLPDFHRSMTRNEECLEERMRPRTSEGKWDKWTMMKNRVVQLYLGKKALDKA